MISHLKKFIFIHTPKCAGISMFRTLSKYIDETHFGHYSPMEYNDNQFADYFKFAFVRNPWDRYVSLYDYWTINVHKLGHFHAEDTETAKLISKHADSFSKFCKLPNEFLLKIHKTHFLTQVEFLNIIGKNKNTLDFIGKYESLQTDFNTICRHINIKQTQLVHINRTTNHMSIAKKLKIDFDKLLIKRKKKFSNYVDYYDDETRSLVAKKYAKDIDYFNYKFGE